MTAVAPADILAANQRAMKLLGDGEMEASHDLLTQTLTQAEQMVKNIPPPASSAAFTPGTAAQQTTAQQEVLLAYSVTLNNLGCQLRREDQLDGALQSIQRASEVEYALFGKPACSTMLNLSSVLVGMGRSEEALPIAKSCVLAAQGGEPTLLITALHNLAVALGQQPTKKERQLALSTMLRALRESEAKLGDHHPTTVMLRQKCGMTSPWIMGGGPTTAADEASASPPTAETTTQSETPARHAASDVATSADGTPPTTATQHQQRHARGQNATAGAAGGASTRERGRKALATLNFGSPHGSPLLPASVQPAAPPPVEHKRLSEGAEPVSRAPPRDLPPLPEVVPTADATSANDTTSPLSTEPDAPVPAVHQQRPSVAMGGSLMTANSLPSLHAERRCSSVPVSAVQPEKNGSSSSSAAAVPRPPAAATSAAVKASREVEPARAATAGNASMLASLRADAASQQPLPRYMRFAPSDASAETQLGATSGLPVAQNAAESVPSYGRSRPACGTVGADRDWRISSGARARPAVAQTAPADYAMTPGPTSATATATNVTAATRAEPVMEVHRSAFYNNPSSRLQREAFRQHRQVEEDAYRQRRHRRTAEMEAEERFQAKLRVIETRRDNRAATTIQKAWHHWWYMIGHPRFLLQKRQAEERKRRRAERLAMEIQNASAGGGSGPGHHRKGQKSSTHPGGGGAGAVDEDDRVALMRRAMPSCVVRCAETWLRKTECRRYMVRHKYNPLPRYIRERQVENAIVRVQAMFRGQRVRRAAIHWDTVAPEVDPHEEREYAAMVIQRAFRCARARRIRRALHLRKYTEPTRHIQAWLRTTMADHRSRGVDSRSVARREDAAVCIQAAWRGYRARVAYLVLRLRSTIDKTRALELRTRLCLQRVGRGLLVRQQLGAYRASVLVHTAMQAQQTGAGAAQTAADGALVTVASDTPRWTELVIPRNAYEASCLERAPALARQRELEREQYDVAMYVQPNAERERQAWLEALRLRPTEVAIRRANEDLRTELEAHTVLQDRAAAKIQRLFREWHRHFHNTRRDRDLLLRSRGLYQQKELEIKFQRQQRAKELARGVAFAGTDCSAPVRAYREPLQAELRALESIQPVAVETVRARDERHYDEHVIQRDEDIVRTTYPADLARLREDLDARRDATGKVYEHPYYKPYPNDAFRMTLGID